LLAVHQSASAANVDGNGALSLAALIAEHSPYAAVQAQSFHTPNFSEGSSSGSTLYALSYASHTGSVTRAELGSWLSNNYLLAGDAAAVLFGRAAWAHDWQNDLHAAPTFLTLPTASFIVNGAKPAADLAVVTRAPSCAWPAASR
jgi:Autotransporter beta-domain